MTVFCYLFRLTYQLVGIIIFPELYNAKTAGTKLPVTHPMSKIIRHY